MKNQILSYSIIFSAGCLFACGEEAITNIDNSNLLTVIENGTSLNGVKLNGVKLNGVKLNGVKLNGVKLNGVKLNGSSLVGNQESGKANATVPP
jgi:uncharacterized protein YjbI with pentapeptide repeats